MGKKLTALDLAFLGLETARTPVNIGSLQIFETPRNYKGNFVRDLLVKLSREVPGPPFNMKLESSRIPARPQWVVDENFDIDYHVRHSALPKPGEWQELLTLASRLHSRIMDRARPLWEFHLIEGLGDDRFAIYMKLHHAAIDGMGGIALLESCLSEDPDAPALAPWHVRAEEKRAARINRMPRANLLARGLIGQLKSAPEVVKLFASHGLKALGLMSAESPHLFAAPTSIFNTRITAARRFGVRSISLTEIKSLAKQLHATVNDIVLAICGGALRAYLLKHDALPKKTLVASIPVSIRHIERSGNQITYIAAQLATEFEDPLQRLDAIKNSTEHAKRELLAVSSEAAITFAVAAQGAVALLNRFQLGGFIPPPANVVISNVPGPRKALYLGGAKMVASYPLSVLVDGQALNITVMSYCDNVDFGLMACRDAVPDVNLLAEYIGEAFDALVVASASHTPAKKSKKPLRKKAVKKTGASRQVH